MVAILRLLVKNLTLLNWVLRIIMERRDLRFRVPIPLDKIIMGEFLAKFVICKFVICDVICE
jgi:hypothetical protein